MLHPVHQRIAELSLINRRRPLSLREEEDFKNCLRVNETMAYEEAKLKNLSFIAFEANDTDWQHDICARIEEMEADFK